MKAIVLDLEESERCYPLLDGAAKGPDDISGMIAANVMRGDLSIAPWEY